MDLLNHSPQEFVQLLQAHNCKSFYFKSENGKFKASLNFLQPVADILANGQDYDNHEALFVQLSSTNVLLSACIHRSCRGPGAGGVRNWHYSTMLDFFSDGLRLSKGMTHKNALAGIWWGGGKGVMARNSGLGLLHDDLPRDRQIVYEDYGKFMTRLRGCYVTAEDVGTSVNDMAAIFTKTRYTTCIPPELGGSGMHYFDIGNPSIATARGVLRGLEAAFQFAGKSLVGSTLAVQGAGHVGIPLMQFAFKAGVKRIIASDVDLHRREKIQGLFSGLDFELHIVQKGDNDILFLDVDAICPCATGGILNKVTIPKIKSRIVCGAANNQLDRMDADSKLLHDNGIIYIPDFLVNRMGIVNCADEHMGVIDNDPKLDLHLGSDWDNSIFRLTLNVLNQSKSTERTTQEIAIEMANERSLEINPIYGHRSLKIIDFVTSSWTRE